MKASQTSLPGTAGGAQTKTSVTPATNSSKTNAIVSSGTSLLPTLTQALTVDNRKNDALHFIKPQKEISGRSRANIRLEEANKNPVERLSRRSISVSSVGSSHLHRCLSKVMWNIQHAREYPLRTKKLALPKRVLPSVPDPSRVGRHPAGKGNNELVKLVYRVRPSTFHAQDRLIISDQAVEILQADPLKSNGKMKLVFGCDKAFYGGTQKEVYKEILQTPLFHALDGFSGLIMLCGRKGTGKTYSIRGEDENYDYRGLIPRALQEIFRQVQLRSHQYDIRVSVSYYDLVGETILDLLAEKVQTTMTECSYRNVTYLKELACARINNEDEALSTYLIANDNRQRMQAEFKKKPIESHTFFTLYFEIHSKLLTEETFKVSKVTLLELASVTNLKYIPRIIPAVHDVLLDTNKSIGHLEEAMNLRLTGDMPIKKIPCRQSKLVYALKDILTDERGKITVMACLSSEGGRIKETISILKFASHLKGIYVVPQSNVLPDHQAMLKKMTEQAKWLKMELRMYDLLNARESPDYIAHSGMQDIFRTAREVKDFVEGGVSAPKFATYRQLENFLNLLKKFAKDGDLATAPLEIFDRIAGRDNLQVTVNEAEDTKVSSTKDFLDTDGAGELDDKDGVGVGKAPYGIKGKNVKSLMKKRKDDKTLKTVKSSVTNAKKPETTTIKKTDKNMSANSPLSLKDHLSDIGHSAGSAPAEADALKVDEPAAPSIVKPGDVTNDSKVGVNLSSLGSSTVPIGGLPAGPPISFLQKTIPKADAYFIFTTKIPNGMEPFRVTEAQRQIVAAKEKTQVDLAVAVNGWIEQLSLSQSLLEKLREDRTKTKIQTNAKFAVLTFEECKISSQIKQLRSSIGTGYDGIQTCQLELAGLRQKLTDSRKKLLSNFEEWYARTYEESPCTEGLTLPQPIELSVVPTQGIWQAVPTSIKALITPTTGLSTTLSPFTSLTKNEEALLLDAISNHPNVTGSLSYPQKLAPKDALEQHKRELASFADINPEAVLFYRVRDKVRKIIRAREEKEAYHRLHPHHPTRTLQPEPVKDSLALDLPSALHRDSRGL